MGVVKSGFRPAAIVAISVAAILTVGACGSSRPMTYRGIDLPPLESVGTNLPPAWLITGAEAVAASIPAFSWGGQLADPAYGLPDLDAVRMKPQDRLTVVVGTLAVKQVEPAIRPWAPDGRIVPLFDEANRAINFLLDRDGGLTVATLGAIPEQGGQLILVHVTYESGDAFYIWRLNISWTVRCALIEGWPFRALPTPLDRRRSQLCDRRPWARGRLFRSS